jgi:hypothetical protein
MAEFSNVINFVESLISENKSDVVHDLLSYLAEQMIDMSKKKNEEIKGFFKWLEREIEANIENFKNKTTLKEFHNYDFDKFLDVLKENQKNITINLLERKTQERLEKHFNDSISILEPLKARIKATDALIDEIVYRLYGLTEEEIKIIEGKI